ncbi:MAG: GNAT family N-acetyltransferase [Pseudobacter sp.]|uniref:GNAT family N-acetyltransferase n=1 Tax=Pseudobacter sp. TaxID=2045420 RepID=UPI003F818ED5
MQEQFKALPLVNNKELQRFELEVDGYTAFIEYKESGKQMILIHTEVPTELEGQGVGTAIVEKALESLEANQQKLVPLCPFVIAFLKRHPEWNRLLSDSVKKD